MRGLFLSSKMPSTLLKELHVAKSIKDLDAKTNISKEIANRPTNRLVITANKLIQEADQKFVDKDEELSYIQYMRFIEVAMEINKRVDAPKNDSRRKLMINVSNAINKASSLKESLIDRYNNKDEAPCISKIEQNNLITTQVSKQVEENKKSFPVISETEVVTAEKLQLSISCKQLFTCIQSNTHSTIIMDIRSAEDFEASHIKYSQCVNIPMEILLPGTTALKLEGLLPQESLASWYNRDKVERIVIVDWDSEDEFTTNLPVKALKEAMCKWDQKTKLKNNPMILSGGYKDWMICYPMLTTKYINFDNTNKLENSQPPISDWSNIEYPDLDEKPKQNNSSEKNEILNGSGPLFKKLSVPNHSNHSLAPHLNNVASRDIKSAPTFDRKSKPTPSAPPNSAPSTRKPSDCKSLQILKNDLGGHHNGSQSHDDDKKEKMVLENLETANELLVREKEMENLLLKKQLEAVESAKSEIQKQENLLHEKIKKLEKSLKITADALEKMEEEKHAQKEEDKIKEANLKKKRLLDEVDKLRKERKKQEALSKQKVEIPKPNSTPRNTSSAGSALKRNLNNSNQNNSQTNEYTIPLSRENSTDSVGRGLVRSHSSPNIAQLVNQEESPQRLVPSVDRSLKPKPTPPQQYPSALRVTQRDFHPVYGNCPARAATGLRNLGNTCFMNAVIQCLSNTSPLAEYFTTEQYIVDLNRDNRDRQGTGGELAEEFAAVIKALWSGHYKSFSPKDFKNSVGKCHSVFIGNEQQDSHEFLVVLMEKLHADLSRRAIRPIPKLDSAADENMFWMHHKKYNSSPIEKIFEGLLKSTLTCLSCNKTSESYEVFSCLSLPILSSRCSLRDCVRLFLKPEKISGEAAWDCPRCKQKKEAEKRLHISHLPEVLVIQLKRFSYEGLWRRKLQTCVDFDFMFDMPYQKNSSGKQYYLYGVVNHFGTLEGGHYTACCKSTSKKWYKYDDHEVSEMSPSDIQTSAAYLLFYHAVE